MAAENNNGFIAFISGLVIGIGLLYVGGWAIAWNDFVATKKALYVGHGLAIEFNNRYYGFLFKSRFFDSPVVSWILGFIALSSLSAGLKALLTENEENEQADKCDD